VPGRAAVQGAGDPDALVGGGVAHAGAGAQPGGGGLDRGALVGTGGAAAVDPGQLPQPLAFQAFQQSTKDQDPPGGLRVGEGVEVLGGQLLHRGGQPVQPARLRRRMCVRVHARNPSHPTPGARSDRQIVNNFLA
jgi:hypothetical protein